MVKLVVNFLFTLFTALTFASLVSCTHVPDVAGRWQEIGTTGRLELHRDGTFNAVDDMGMAVSGKYVLQEDGNIRFEIIRRGSPPEIINRKVSVHGNELTFSSPDNGEIETYTRINDK